MQTLNDMKHQRLGNVWMWLEIFHMKYQYFFKTGYIDLIFANLIPMHSNVLVYCAITEFIFLGIL